MEHYLRHVERQCQQNPCLNNLLHFLRDGHTELDVTVHWLDFFGHVDGPTVHQSHQQGLISRLTSPRDEPFGLCGRIVIIEDLTRHLLAFLGSHFDIDPIFFASHIRATSPWQQEFQTPDVALPPSRAKNSGFINIHYHRTVTIQHEEPRARHYTRTSNVSRKVTFLREKENRRFGLAPQCCSVFHKVLRNKTWICTLVPTSRRFHASDRIPGLILVDRGMAQGDGGIPELPTGLQFYLGGYEDFITPPSVMDTNARVCQFPQRARLLGDLTNYWIHGFPDGFNKVTPSLFTLSYYPLRIIVGEWMNYLVTMKRSTKKYDYKMEGTDQTKLYLDLLNEDLRSLQGWLRRTMSTQQKIASVMRFLDATHSEHPELKSHTQLRDDYECLATSIEACAHKLEVTLPVTTSMVQIVDSRRSLLEASYISRLTYLALVFLPLTFISGLFSMEGTFGSGNSHFWIYFAVAVPLTLLVLFLGAPLDEQRQQVWNRLQRIFQQ